jgi:tetratricopeptide (TPR) repeat protein
MAARFTYFPSVPLSLCTAAVVVTRLSALSARWRAIALALSGSWLIGLSACTVHHLSFWRDDVTLWTRVLDLGPALSARALLERSNGYARRSEPRLALADIEEAITRAPSEKYPEIHELFMARAMILVTLGRIADAIDDYTRALELAKGGVRAEILIYRAALYEAIGNPSAAAADYESATGRRRAP